MQLLSCAPVERNRGDLPIPQGFTPGCILTDFQPVLYFPTMIVEDVPFDNITASITPITFLTSLTSSIYLIPALHYFKEKRIFTSLKSQIFYNNEVHTNNSSDRFSSVM